MRVVRLVLLVLAAVGLAGCDPATLTDVVDGGETKPVLGAARVAGQPNAVAIRFSGCDEAAPIEVAETDTEVRVIVRGSGGCEPLYRRVVGLSSPLADRAVIDATTGLRIELSADEGDP